MSAGVGFLAALWPFLLGALFGGGTYAGGQLYREEEITPTGTAVAMGFGAATGGMGSVLAGAAGGGIVGNAVWRPGFAAINTAGQLIAQDCD